MKKSCLTWKLNLRLFQRLPENNVGTEQLFEAFVNNHSRNCVISLFGMIMRFAVKRGVIPNNQESVTTFVNFFLRPAPEPSQEKEL